MENDEHIVRYTAAELAAMRARGKTLTDWARFDAMTDEELEASIDWEEEGEPDWDNAMAGIPGPQQRVSLLVDDDIIAWFRAEVAGTGLGYKTRMNEVLREYVAARREQEQEQPVATGASATRRAG